MGASGSLRPAARVAVHRSIAFAASAAGFLAAARRRRGQSRKRELRSIVVIRIDLLGDVLFTGPLVEALRNHYPEAHITMVTLPYTAPLARSFTSVDDVVEIDSNRVRSLHGILDTATWRSYRDAIAALRRLEPDLVISTAGKTASLLALLSGGRRTIGYDDEAFRFTLSDPLIGGRYAERKHEVEYVRALARYAGAGSAPSQLSVRVSPDADATVGALLRDLPIRPGAPLVVVHAGSVNGTAKRWPPASWSEFAQGVSQYGIDVVLAGAKSDEPIAREVVSGSNGAAHSLVGRTSIEELIALLARADLVATGDSGPLHLAVALGRPLLCVYGPTDPLVHGPYNPSAPVRLHRVDLPCSPCYTMAAMADCPLGDPICMRLVTVPTMLHSALELLASQP